MSRTTVVRLFLAAVLLFTAAACGTSPTAPQPPLAHDTVPWY